jgi:cation transport ATPase
VDTPSTDTSAATTDIGSQPSTSEPTTSTDTSGAAETTNTENQTSTDQTETSSTETTQSSDENTTSDQPNETSGEADSNETETTSEESTSSSESEEQEVEETSSDESAEDSTEESSEETTEENSEEDTTEEESSEESEEESQEESSDEEEEDNKKKRKRALAPPILTANVMSMQDPLGNFSTAVNIGMSQSSLMGDKTYGLNAMVYSNMQQFMLTANFSKVHINDKGRVNRVYSASIGGAKMYTTYMAMTNHSLVFLGKKGSVFGTALGLNLTSLELDIREGYIYYDEQILGASLTTFYTKPFNFDRLTISPMLAASAPFASMDLYFGDGISFNKDVMFITGSSFNYQLTKRFIANIGANAISATIKDFPVIWSFTIGSRFQF